jgi:beta-glucanase (GH16 family)
LREILKSLVVVGVLCIGASVARAQGWSLVWSDEFEGKAGAAPDGKSWTYDTGGNGWGNQELETYCSPGKSEPAPCNSDKPNVFLDGKGHLAIRAERVNAAPVPAGSWTSGRMKSEGLRDFTFGRMEACIAMPLGAGIWPAFWLLGSEGKWPAGGEIDIMENIPSTVPHGPGMGPGAVQATIHGTTKEAGKAAYDIGQRFTFPVGQGVNDPACHIYGVVRSKYMLQFYVDDWRKPFFITTASDLKEGDAWPFEAPFFFILNVAVGGSWPGPPDASTESPSDMSVDYVRVYEAQRQDTFVMAAEPIAMQADQTGSTTLQVKGTAGMGFVYVTCSSAVPGTKCAMESGNSLNESVLDLRERAEATAKVKVTGAAALIVVKAYTVGGVEATLRIEVGRR